jgi:hypothetical protein
MKGVLQDISGALCNNIVALVGIWNHSIVLTTSLRATGERRKLTIQVSVNVGQGHPFAERKSAKQHTSRPAYE